MFLHLLLLLPVLVISLHLYFRYNRGGRLIYKIKGPKETFLFGNLFDIFVTPEQTFLKQIEWHRTYGNLWKLNGMDYRAVFLYEPEHIEQILSSTQYLDKDIPYTFLYPWLRKGLLTSTGQKWQHRRKMLTPAFHFLILKKFFRTFYERAEDLIKTLEEEADSEKTDLFPVISKSMLSVMCETSMGTATPEDLDATTNKYFKPLHTLVQTIVYRIPRLWLYTEFTFQFTKAAKLQKDALKTVHQFTTQIIQDRREFREKKNIAEYSLTNDDDVYGKKSKLAMLDLLLDEEKKGRIDEEGIKEEVDTFLFEGHDTTATAITFMIMRIANEPDVQELIYEEMRSIFNNTHRPPTIEDLSQMKYLECCIKESLRLYPSVPFISRYLHDDVQLGDIIIPRDTMCNFHIYDIHRNPEIYPDPEKFVPERFLPENCINRHPYAYIPFSAGPRNCIGQKFALMEIKTVMSSILRKYQIKPVTKPEDLIFTCDLVLRTTHPIYVKFCKRIN